MNKEQRKIAIIGAGWVGIGCMRMLLASGYQTEVFEFNSDIGGVWNPCNHYSGLTIHSRAKDVEFFDFPLPSFINKTERISAKQIFNYLRDYCKLHNFYAFIRFNTHVEKIKYNSQTHEYELELRDINTKKLSSRKYDYVIYTHGFCSQTIPIIKGMKNFSGRIIHSFNASQTLIESLVEQNKKVTIVGASKTATDLILQFQQYAYRVFWLYRRNYWFINRDHFFNSDYKKLENKKYIFISKLVFIISNLCISIHPKIGFYCMRLFNLIHTFGKKHNDFKRFHNGALDKNQIKILRQYNEINHIRGQIDSFYKEGVILDTGTHIKTDYVIFCTGSSPCESLIEINIDGRKLDINNIKKMYRSRVIPQLPHLIFTAFSPFALGVVNGLCYGNWIIQYIASNFKAEDLDKDCTIFERPFFQQHILFNSTDYVMRMSLKMLKPFFISGELSKIQFAKWHLNNAFSLDADRPLIFNAPNKEAATKPFHRKLSLNPLIQAGFKSTIVTMMNKFKARLFPKCS